MKLKEQWMHTDRILLLGLLLGAIKTSFGQDTAPVMPELLDKLLTLSMCACYGLHVLLRKPGFRCLAAYAAAAGIGAASALRSGDMSGMITLLTCIALADCDFDRVVKKLFRWNLALFFFKVGCSLILAAVNGPVGPLLHEYHEGLVRYQNGDYALHFGFGHKNSLAMYMISMFMMWVWLYFDRLKIRQVLAVMAGASLILIPNQCKTAYLVLAFIGVLVIFFRWKQMTQCTLMQFAAALGPAFLYVFSLAVTHLYRQGSAFAAFLSGLLTGRIHLCAVAWDQYGPTFFGNLASDINSIQGRIAYIDNLYLHATLQMGAIWAIAFCIAFFLLARKTRDLRVHLCILCWCLYAFVENVGINGLIFMPSLLPALLLSSQRKKAPAAIS